MCSSYSAFDSDLIAFLGINSSLLVCEPLARETSQDHNISQYMFQSMNAFVENISQPNQKLKYQEKCLCKCLFVQQRISRLDCQSKFQMYRRCTPTSQFNTGLCKFVQNISRNIWALGKRTDLINQRSANLYLSPITSQFLDLIH